MKPNAYIDKYMTYESTSESKYHFYWANDQYYHDYGTGFNLVEKATWEKNAGLLGINYISFPKTSIRSIFTSINILRVTFEKHADTRVGLLAKFPLPRYIFNPGNESTNTSKTPKIKLHENPLTGL